MQEKKAELSNFRAAIHYSQKHVDKTADTHCVFAGEGIQDVVMGWISERRYDASKNLRESP
jgi:hypothetical protein